MTFNNDEQNVQRFMEEIARQDAQLQRGYDRMAFIAGLIVGLIGAAQNESSIQSWVVLPLFTGGVFVLIRKFLRNN